MGTLGLLFVSIVFIPSPTLFASYILCSRDAEILPVNPSEVSESDPCTGSVLLQGISYECTSLDEVDSKRRKFLEDLKSGGKKFCEDYCRKRSSLKVKCSGSFIEPTQCGFTVKTEEAERYGREVVPCNPSCGGTAFAQCSIYHTGSLKIVPSHFEGQRPNCYCEVR